MSSNVYKGPSYVESYLMKKKKRPNNRNKTSLRYLKFDLNDKSLYFKDKKENPEIKVVHIGKDLKSFDDKINPEDAKFCEWNYGFKINTSTRNYILYAETKDIYLKWIRVLNFHFKKIDIFNSQSPIRSTSYPSEKIDIVSEDEKEKNYVQADINLINTKPNNFGKNEVKTEEPKNNNDFNFLDEDFDILKEEDKKKNNIFNNLSSKKSPSPQHKNYKPVDNNINNNKNYNVLPLPNPVQISQNKNLAVPLQNKNTPLQNNVAPTRTSKKNYENFVEIDFTPGINKKSNFLYDVPTKNKNSRSFTPADRKKLMEEDANDFKASDHLTEFIINNVKNSIKYDEEEIRPKYHIKKQKQVEPIKTKVQIHGGGNYIPPVMYEYDEVEEKMERDAKNNKAESNKKLEEEVEAKLVNPLNKENNRSMNAGSLSKYNNLFKNLNEDSDDEENQLKKLNTVFLKQEDINANPKKKVRLNSNNISEERVIEPFLDNKDKEINNILEQISINSDNSEARRKTEWVELNDDWDTDKKQPLKTNDVKNKNPSNDNIILQPKQKMKSQKIEASLFDERNLHIKKCPDSKKIAIENLHFGNTMVVPSFNSLDVLKVTNQPIKVLTQSKMKVISKKPGKDEEYRPDDVKLDSSRIIKMAEGDEYSVKRKIIKTHDNTKSFVLNLTIPENLTKIAEATDRIKLMSEQAFNPKPEHAVYTGKPKTNLEAIQIQAEVKNEEGGENQQPGEVQLVENIEQVPDLVNMSTIKPNLNVTALIMKNMDTNSYINSLKTREGVVSRKLRDEVVYDEFLLRINSTLKIDTYTFQGDEHHLPVSQIQESAKNVIPEEKQKSDLNTSRVSKEDGYDIDPNFKIPSMNPTDNINLQDISRISRHYSQLDIEEVWDNSIIDDDMMFDIK